MKTLSVVIPAYNEEANMARTLTEVSGVARELNLEYEILGVNDGSADGTGDIMRQMMLTIPNLKLVEHFPNRGYGGALKAGFAAASGDLITFVPADGQFVFSEIERLLSAIDTADIVCGIRDERQDPFLRRLNGWGWNTAVRLMFGYLAEDVDCGFKMLRREVIEQVPLPSDGAMIDTELLAGASARGFRIEEVWVTHRPRMAGSATGANLQVIAKAFRELVGFRRELTRQMAAAPKMLHGVMEHES
jgi:glycosyltransferase involved in cell wall biosynthesis